MQTANQLTTNPPASNKKLIIKIVLKTELMR